MSCIKQTVIQKYLMEDLLGISTEHIFLIKKDEHKNSDKKRIFLWKDMLKELNSDGSPDFIKNWINRYI